MYKVAIIGSVTSTAHTLLKLLEYNFDVIAVMGYESPKKGNVSGWYNLRQLSEENGLTFRGFVNINEECHIQWMKSKAPAIIFAVGFSQLLSSEWLNLPKLGCVGFHPTLLPRGRGRAPLAWLILEEDRGAANFFLMGEGADDGPIFIQEPFDVTSEDDAISVREKILKATDAALDRWLPELYEGNWNPVEQDEYRATYYGKRSPSDGLINWNGSDAEEIDKLVRASTHPHPGAFTVYDNQKLIVWKTRMELNLKIKGVPGRVLKMDNEELLVQCREGLLWLVDYEYDGSKKIVEGVRLGYNVEFELYKIWKRLEELRA